MFFVNISSAASSAFSSPSSPLSSLNTPPASCNDSNHLLTKPEVTTAVATCAVFHSHNNLADTIAHLPTSPATHAKATRLGSAREIFI